MRRLLFAHHNNCPRCPVIGAEDIPGEEYFEILALRFSIRVAQQIARGIDRFSLSLKRSAAGFAMCAWTTTM